MVLLDEQNKWSPEQGEIPKWVHEITIPSELRELFDGELDTNQADYLSALLIARRLPIDSPVRKAMVREAHLTTVRYENALDRATVGHYVAIAQFIPDTSTKLATVEFIDRLAFVKERGIPNQGERYENDELGISVYDLQSGAILAALGGIEQKKSGVGVLYIYHSTDGGPWTGSWPPMIKSSELEIGWKERFQGAIMIKLSDEPLTQEETLKALLPQR